jgi:hypothetical protein
VLARYPDLITGLGLLAGPRKTPPSAKLNLLPCHGQVTPLSVVVPSSSDPPMWLQVLANAQTVPKAR